MNLVFYKKLLIFASLSKIIIMNKRILAITAIIFTAAFLRLIPHAPNFSPIGAIALFGGAFLNRKYLAYLIPFLALFISDIFLGFYGMSMLVTYGTFACSIYIGSMLRKKLTWYNTAFASVFSSVVFFLITNLVFFYPESTGLYTHDLAGLVNCYAAGLPFFQNTLASDLVYSILFFGSFYLLNVNIPSLQAQKIKA